MYLVLSQFIGFNLLNATLSKSCLLRNIALSGIFGHLHFSVTPASNFVTRGYWINSKLSIIVFSCIALAVKNLFRFMAVFVVLSS